MQFVGKMISSVSEFYKDLNPSTLSGAVDIIVVEDVVAATVAASQDSPKSDQPSRTGRRAPEGTPDVNTTTIRKCSPFHVRFGKLQVLRPQEKRVEIAINGTVIEELAMKVGVEGETFFVLPVPEDEEGNALVMPELLTSPLAKPAKADKEKVQSITLDPTEAKKLGAFLVSPLPKEDAVTHPLSPLSREDKTKPPKTAPLSDSELEVKKRPSSSEGSDNSSREVASSEAAVPQQVPPQAAGSSWNWMWGSTPAIKEPFPAVSSFPLDARLYELYEVVESFAVLKFNYATLRAALLNHVAFDARMLRLDRGAIVRTGTDLSTPKQMHSLVLSRGQPIDYNMAISDAPFEHLGQSLLLISANGYTSLLPADVALWILNTWMLFRRLVDEQSVMSFVGAIDRMTATAKHPSDKDGSHPQEVQRIGWRQWWSSRRKEPSTATTSSKEGKTAAATAPAAIQPKEAVGDGKAAKPLPEAGDTLLRAGVAAAASPVKSGVAAIASDDEVDRRAFTKSLRLPPETLARLPLKPGVNTVTFTVTTKLQGRASCQARIFLLRSDARIVISDVDGTITKSDALGHLFTMVGKDWTHPDVASLYTRIARNGYTMVYLTSRAIGQAAYTRGYLAGIIQDRFQLPDGPLIMSPDRLFTALRREVLVGNPEEFKIAALQDIRRLFPADSTPFYAGFGNRITDARAYAAVGIPTHRIFTVNPTGIVNLEHARLHSSSYGKLVDLVDSIFPPLSQHGRLAGPTEAFGDFAYWRGSLVGDDRLFQAHLAQVLHDTRKRTDPLMILPPEAMEALGGHDLTSELLPGDLEYEFEEEGDDLLRVEEGELYDYEYFGPASATGKPKSAANLSTASSSITSGLSPRSSHGDASNEEPEELEEAQPIVKYPY